MYDVMRRMVMIQDEGVEKDEDEQAVVVVTIQPFAA